MTLLLVRHAVALRRRDWSKADDLRPLRPIGHRQADALPDLLGDYGVDRILSSPSRRCVETVQPLAGRLGVPVEEVAQLAEGAGAAAASLLRRLPGVVVACSHGDVLPELLAVLAPSAVDDDEEVPCAKGSTWVLEDDGVTTYLPPPA
jgi:8-oxo-dGTP diphosphatase